jgi:glycosyltransferase involved in cell wall biosynthesis
MAFSEVRECYAWADVFLHTGVVDAEGDRDGLPNVIPEAFSYELPVVCGTTPGAIEAVIDEETGLVVDIDDPAAIAAALQRLHTDAKWRAQLGRQGRRWTEENFLTATNTAKIARAFQAAVLQL